MTAHQAKRLPEQARIIFMGTPDFAVPSLEMLISRKYHVQGVVTQPDRPKGRSAKPMPPPVKVAAERLGIKVFQPENTRDASFCRLVGSLCPDLLVVIAFGQILSEPLLNAASWGALNIHASLLPKYRGAAPIQRAIINGERETGLSAMRMNRGLDTGPVLFQEQTSIETHETAGSLHDRLSKMAAPFLTKTLRALAEETVYEIPQDKSLATYAPKIDRNTGLISWDRTSDEISALIRGLDPWPGAYTMVNGKRLKLFSPRVLETGKGDAVPGRVKGHSQEGLLVETADGVILITALQLAGRKRVRASDFLRGFPINRETVLGK